MTSEITNKIDKKLDAQKKKFDKKLDRLLALLASTGEYRDQPTSLVVYISGKEACSWATESLGQGPAGPSPGQSTGRP